MSFAALNWACSIRDADVSAGARHVLLTLAQFADEAATCYPSHATLAAITNLSEDTIQRRIRDLVDHRLVFVVKRKNNDGRRLTNYYVLLNDEEARAHALAHGWEPDSARQNRSEDRTQDGGDEAAAEGVQPAGCGLEIEGVQPAGETEPCRRVHETNPQLCGIEPSNNHQGTNPPTPQGGREGGASQSGEEGALRDGGQRSEDRSALRTQAALDAARLARWDEFERLWPWDATELPGQARAVFMRLSDDEQRLAIDAAPQYAAACKTRETRARNHGMAHARRWLTEEGWKVVKARTLDSAASKGGLPFTVRQGSEQAAAWARYEEAVYGAPRLRYIPSKALGMVCTRPTEWPPPIPKPEAG
jgi:hypothetical protein